MIEHAQPEMLPINNEANMLNLFDFKKSNWELTGWQHMLHIASACTKYNLFTIISTWLKSRSVIAR